VERLASGGGDQYFQASASSPRSISDSKIPDPGFPTKALINWQPGISLITPAASPTEAASFAIQPDVQSHDVDKLGLAFPVHSSRRGLGGREETAHSH